MRVMALMLLLLALPLRAEETLLLRESSIKAMEGLPTVTFVVPWQSSRPADFVTLPQESVLDDALLPLDGALLPPRQTVAEKSEKK
ncbi:MAG TPA: hypothetical protein VGE50_11940 [Gammaproteobacteria bacterium]